MNIRELPSTIKLTRDFIRKVEVSVQQHALTGEPKELLQGYIVLIESELVHIHSQEQLEYIARWLLEIVRNLPEDWDRFEKDEALIKSEFEKHSNENNMSGSSPFVEGPFEKVVDSTKYIAGWIKDFVFPEISKLELEWQDAYSLQILRAVRESIGIVLVSMLTGKYKDPVEAYFLIINALSSVQKKFPRGSSDLLNKIFEITTKIEDSTIVKIEKGFERLKRTRTAY